MIDDHGRKELDQFATLFRCHRCGLGLGQLPAQRRIVLRRPARRTSGPTHKPPKDSSFPTAAASLCVSRQEPNGSRTRISSVSRAAVPTPRLALPGEERLATKAPPQQNRLVVATDAGPDVTGYPSMSLSYGRPFGATAESRSPT